jgi:hypothetical protein
MAYVIIPDGFTLKKVTKQQEQAVNAYFRHENTNTLLENVNTPLVVGGMIGAFVGVKLADSIIADLENRLGALSFDVKQGIRDTVDIELNLPTLGGPTGAQAGIDLINYIKGIV